jgi:hypothetical protein
VSTTASAGSGDQARPADPTGAPQLAERIAEAVRLVPGVAGLHGGAFGEVATYLAGRPIVGVRITEYRTEIHLTALVGYPVHDLADAVRTAVRGLTGTPVDITVEDLALTSTS